MLELTNLFQVSNLFTQKEVKRAWHLLSWEFKPNLIINNRSSHRRYSIKKLFLKILEYSQENSCGGASF